MKKAVIIIAFKDFRDEEYFVPKEILKRVNMNVKTASNKQGIAIGADGGEVKVDLLVQNIKTSDFDAVVFIGGSGCLDNLDNEQSYRVAQEFFSVGKLVSAICISPVILAKTGILQQKQATVWHSDFDKSPIRILQENGANYQDKEVVIDGNIITSPGPEAAKAFGEAIVGYLAY